MHPRPIIQALLLCSFVSFSAVADDDDDDSGVPGFIKGPILHQIYDGATAERDSKHLPVLKGQGLADRSNPCGSGE